MADKYVEKKHKNKDGKEVVTKYRVDAAFIPSAVKEICEEFIQNYCEANDKVEWLTKQYESKEVAVAKTTTKRRQAGDKYEIPKSFVSIRSDFVEAFFPDIIKGGKNDTPRDKWLKKHKKASK